MNIFCFLVVLHWLKENVRRTEQNFENKESRKYKNCFRKMSSKWSGWTVKHCSMIVPKISPNVFVFWLPKWRSTLEKWVRPYLKIPHSLSFTFVNPLYPIQNGFLYVCGACSCAYLHFPRSAFPSLFRFDRQTLIWESGVEWHFMWWSANARSSAPYNTTWFTWYIIFLLAAQN